MKNRFLYVFIFFSFFYFLLLLLLYISPQIFFARQNDFHNIFSFSDLLIPICCPYMTPGVLRIYLANEENC